MDVLNAKYIFHDFIVQHKSDWTTLKNIFWFNDS